MDRQDWLAGRRAAVVACYDQEAPGYDEHDYPSDTQRDWVGRLLARCPAGSLVLDAPCGTGKYFPLVAAAGHRVVGADQSAGMLAQARRRGTALALAQAMLQQLPYTGAFDAVLTIDAMENVPPEDWPRVLASQRRALRPGGVLYLTVEEVAGPVVDAAFQALTSQGQPAVRGEVVEGDVAGYHYYPAATGCSAGSARPGCGQWRKASPRKTAGATGTSCSAERGKSSRPASAAPARRPGIVDRAPRARGTLGA